VRKNSKNVSIINKGCNLKGDFDFEGYLILAGAIIGNLNAEIVATEKESHIYGIVRVKTLTIAGSFEGEITATDTLTLLDTANVNALIKCGKLVIEKGCILNGKTESLPTSPDS